jgi:hypothetical protein
VKAQRFDAWTRRRFGLVAGGLLTLLGGWSAAAERGNQQGETCCRALLTRCRPGNTPKCCKGTRCKSVKGEHICCKPAGKTCHPFAKRNDCCPGLTCSMTDEVCR